MNDFAAIAASPLLLVAALALGYVIGSIPFGLLFTRLGGLGDVRNIGSGNVGATNVLRTGNKFLAAATLTADILKGAVSVWLVSAWLSADMTIFAGLGAFLGHLFPIWLKFKGGKGVATYIGVLLGLFWPAAIAFCVIWLISAAASRYSSLSGLISVTATPLVLAVFGKPNIVALFIVLTILVIIRHHDNIRRLLSGQETKIGARS